MAMSIDDIWDDSPDDTPPRTRKAILVSEAKKNTPARPSPAKRRRTTLFLSSDSENDSPGPSKTPYRKRTPPQKDRDKQKALIDALFDDLDDNDDGFKELAPALDIDALRRQASQRQNKTRIPALTPHEILPSSSPERDLGPDEDMGGETRQQQGKGKKDADGNGKERKQLAKLDEVRLIGETGFPALIKQTKDFKPRGKGHELSDLNRVLGIYQFWTHKMYPKGTFHDNVQRIEKLCHSKRMHNHLGMWRDAAKGLVNGQKPQEQEPLGDPADDSSSDSELEQLGGASTAPSTSPPTSRSNSVPTRPPSSASSRPSSAAPDDDFDIDAMIREEEERQAAISRPTQQTSFPESQPLSLPDEDQDMWDQLDGGFSEELTMQPPQPPPQISSRGDEMDDQDMWDLFREMEGTAPSVTKPAPVPAAPSGGHPEGSSTEPSVVGGKGQPQATNDEGWDEMYL